MIAIETCLGTVPPGHEIGGLKTDLFRRLPWLKNGRADAEAGGAG